MPRQDPISRDALPELAAALNEMEADHGYVPNSFLTMAWVPGLVSAQDALARALWYPGRIEPEVRQLVSYALSLYAGAMYSAAHTASSGHDTPLDIAQLQQVRDFETSAVYDERQRSLLRLCHAAARIPSEVRDSHFEALRQWFDEEALLRIVGLIAWTSFLNTWNTLFDTRLEPMPRKFAQRHLRQAGWHDLRHR